MKAVLLAAALGMLMGTHTIVAQEHHSDVEFSYANSQIRIEPGAEGLVFEGEFGTGQFSHQASEPGFASEPEEGFGVGANDVIAFNVLDRLHYWNGTEFVSAGDTSISILGVGGSQDTIVSASTGLQIADFSLPTSLLGQADTEGEVHTDLDFVLSDGATKGGYGLVLSLASDAAGIADSPPFGIFLNFGELDDAQFETGVEAFQAIVPEPSSFALGCFACIALLARRHKRSFA